MRVGGAAALVILGWVLAGCGLETVETLASPSADYTNLDLVGDSKISFYHAGAAYTGSVFQGYYVYYKVYSTVSADFSRLQSDRDTLGTSPTVDHLASMGYYRLSASGRKFTESKPTSDTPTDLEPLFFTDLTDGEKITLDFTDFLAKGATTYLDRPVAKLNDVAVSPRPYLYRTQTLSSGHVSFWDLPAAVTATDPDEADWSTSDTHFAGQEINVFVVAYGMTGTLQTVYSKPVPWGVIRRYL